MEVKVLWTETALNQLEDIFEYYKSKVSVKTAKMVVKKLVQKTILLQKSPNIGRIEELLEDRKYEYRFIVEGNYKIIYWFADNLVNIAAVFDTRQNPEKIKNL